FAEARRCMYLHGKTSHRFPMKPTYALATAFAAVLALTFPVLVLPSGPAHSFSSGAPPDFSGPTQYCNYCHGGIDANPVNSGTGTVIITAPDTFEPGEEIPITVSVYSTTVPQGPQLRQGFELSAQDADFNHVGSFNV